jgi:hypothetical protein
VYSPWTFDYNLHRSQEPYLFKFHHRSRHSLAIVEEYGPKIVYLPGKRNIIADALSRLPKLDEPHDESAFLEEIFALDKQTKAFPIAFDVISKAQLADKIQQCITNNDPDFKMRIIQRAPLVYLKGKIVIPTNLRFRILTWYHENLLHPGAD